MKRIILSVICGVFICSTLTGCVFDMVNKQITETTVTFEKMKKDMEPINIDSMKLMINSVSKKSVNSQFKDSDLVENPDGDFYLVIDLTLDNTSKKDFKPKIQLRTKEGNAGKLIHFSNYINSSLDEDVIAGDKLTGQIVFDVVESEEYNLYVEDFSKGFSEKAKISFKKSDIDESDLGNVVEEKPVVTINSVKKELSSCDNCIGMTKPKGDFYLLIDMTIENKTDKSISPVFDMDVKTSLGEVGEIKSYSEYIKTKLPANIKKGETVKGQIFVDVVESDEYIINVADSKVSFNKAIIK